MILKSLSYHPNIHCICFSYFNIQQLQSKTESSWLSIPAVWSIRNIAFTACIFFWTTISKTWIPAIVNIFERYFSTIKELPHLREISWHSHFLRFILSFWYYVAYVSWLTGYVIPNLWYHIKYIALLCALIESFACGMFLCK